MVGVFVQSLYVFSSKHERGEKEESTPILFIPREGTKTLSKPKGRKEHGHATKRKGKEVDYPRERY